MPHAKHQCRRNGRIYVWDTTQRFSLANKSVPIPPSFKEVDTVAVIQDLLWMLIGVDQLTDPKARKDFLKGAFLLRHSHTTSEAMRGFVKKLIELRLIVPDAVAVDPQAFFEDVPIGSFGRVQGMFLRHWPLSELSVPAPTMKRTIDEIAPDLMVHFKEAYDNISDEQKKDVSFDEFSIYQSYSAVDQLSNLAVALKKRRCNTPLLVTLVNPEFYPDEDFTPEENILMKRSPHRPTELMFQCRIESTPENEKDKLHMTVFVDEQEGKVQAPSIALKYAILTHLLALEADMDAAELTIHASASWIDENSTDVLMLQLRPKYDPVELCIAEGVTSIYDVNFDSFGFVTKKEKP